MTAQEIHNKRKRIVEFIDQLFMIFDPSGSNSRKYKDMFQVMSDEEFPKYIDNFLTDRKSNLRWDIDEFGSRKVKFKNVEKAADFVNQYVPCKIFDYIYIPHVSSDPNRPIRSKEKVLLGFLNIKRPQQLASKKTGLTLSDNDRDDLTGTARGKSKAGTTTGVENELLAGVGGDIIISELCGARGDNIAEYDNMVSSIAETGSVKLADIKTNVFDKPTLLQADLFFAAMGLKTDLISESYYDADKIKNIMDNK